MPGAGEAMPPPGPLFRAAAALGPPGMRWGENPDSGSPTGPMLQAGALHGRGSCMEMLHWGASLGMVGVSHWSAAEPSWGCRGWGMLGAR